MSENLLAPSTGLSKSKLESANAQRSHVLAGETFYAGNNELKTGTMANQPNGNQCPIRSTYDGEFCYLYLPIGAYITLSDKGFPYIKRRLVEIVSEAGKTLVDNGRCDRINEQNIRVGNPYSFSSSGGYQFYVCVMYTGHVNGSQPIPATNLNNCQCIFELMPVSTDFDDGLQRRLGKIFIFKANDRNTPVSFTIQIQNISGYGAAVYNTFGIG